MVDFILPDGSVFDTNVGLGDDLPSVPFRDYGNFLSKTRERLSRYGRTPTKVSSFSHIGAEVGDDEIGVSSTPEFPAAELTVFSEYLGVKVSEEDTSINPRFGNFAEDLVIVPDGYEQTYRYAQQTSDFRNMAFLDVPKLRLAIDIRPGRMTHSATNDGKAGILGSRLAWLPRNSPVRTLWEVFNLYQDINLGLIRDDKFAYLPTALGGYGKPIPFGHAPNFEAFAIRYKQGVHAGLARELVRRTITRFREYTIEHRYNTDEVLSAVSRIQSSWHDWIKGKSLYAPTCWLEAPPEVSELRVGVHGTDIVRDAALRRLQAQGYLISESDLAIAWEHNQLCQYLVGAETHEEFLRRRKESRDSWLNLSTFSMRLYGYIAKIGIDVNLHGPLTPDEYREFWTFITKSKLHLRSFLRKENFYKAEAKDLIYNIGPMMVNVPIFPKITSQGRRYWFEPSMDTKNSIETKESFDALYKWVLEDPKAETMPPTVLIEDDPAIIREISRKGVKYAFAIVTDDARLCREAYLSTRVWICRVPVKWYYMAMYYQDEPEPWLAILQSHYPFYQWETIHDTGSIESYEEVGFRDGLPINWPAERPFVLTKPSIREGKRLRAQRTFPEVEDNPDWKPYRFPEGYLYTQNVFRQRHRHPHRRGWA
jgi:hypothetical protein